MNSAILGFKGRANDGGIKDSEFVSSLRSDLVLHSFSF